MATNLVQQEANVLVAAASDPATPSSGDPVVVGAIPGVALTDESDGGNSTGNTTIALSGVWSMSVVGEDGSGNAAVGVGAIIYLDSGELNVDDSNGVRWGYALEAVSSGATSTIKVLVGY